MSEYIHKSHNVTVLIYHLVLPAKYRRVVFDDDVDNVLKEVCLDIEKRYQIKFLEIGTDEDHVHFLVQSVPIWCKQDCDGCKKSYSTRSIQALSPSEEEVMGRGILDRRLLCEHRW